MPNEKTIHFSGLNALRFFSAFAVIFYHCSLSFQEQFPSGIKMLTHNLHMGVDMFFLISGFLIVYLLLVEKEKTKTISLPKFYMRRILRIFPLYFLIIGIAWLQYHQSRPEIPWDQFFYFAGNFWMIETNAWTVGILNPLWSLCIEEHFYLVIPLLVFLIPLHRIRFLFWFIILFSIAFRVYATLTIEYNWFTIYAHTLSRCDVLAIGGLMAWYHKSNRLHFTISPVFMVGMFMYLVLTMMIVDNSDYTTMTFAVLKKYVFILPMAFLFYGMILNPQESRLLLLFKSNTMLDYLGKISFGLYMYHSPVLDFLAGVEWINQSLFIKIIVITLVTIVISALSYELFEKQILKLKSAFEVIRTRNANLDVHDKEHAYVLDHPHHRQPV